jgi:hypothetical protein
MSFDNARLRESDATSDLAPVALLRYKCVIAVVRFCPRFMEKRKSSPQAVAFFMQS